MVFQKKEWPLRGLRKSKQARDLYYDEHFLKKVERAEIIDWLAHLHPLWENRFSDVRPLPEGETQRRLLRPVYWLGNWQFACLDYYRPPNGIYNRCVAAEPFPKALQRLVKQIEEKTHRMFQGDDMPRGWHLNTCLVNFYGSVINGEKSTDTARVGEHKDFEPGPVASLSMGERAMFQFVQSTGPRGPNDESSKNAVVAEQWLDDGGLQIFGGKKWKEETFHRVQRVDTKGGHSFKSNVENFETRRINFTFRYVPVQHVMRFKDLSVEAKADVVGYMNQLAKNSAFFKNELAAV
jgi:DNA oxidative demethylase